MSEPPALFLNFTADRLISRRAPIATRQNAERAVRAEVIRHGKELGYFFPGGIDIYEVTELVPSDPSKPLPDDLVGIRARAIGVLRPSRT